MINPLERRKKYQDRLEAKNKKKYEDKIGQEGKIG